MKLDKLKNIRKLSVTLILVIGIVFSFSSNLLGGVIYASSSYKNPLSNPYFNQSYNSEYISSLNGWSVISYDGYQTARDRDGYKSGSVKASSVTNSKNESNDKLWKNFGLIADPERANIDSDSKYNTYLMLNSPKDLGRIGYQTSTDFTLDANSFYKITVTFKTINNESAVVENLDQDANAMDITVESNSYASIYIKGLSDDTFTSVSKFEKVSTYNQWSTRTFYISTTPYSSEKLKLQVWLGGEKVTDNCQGAVFFNDVDIERFNETFYYEETNKILPSNDYINVINLDTNPYINNQITNPSFEQGWAGWTQLPLTSANSDDKMEIINFASPFFPFEGIFSPRSNNSSVSNRNAVFIYLKNDGFLGVKSNPIEIKANGYYRLSVWTKSDANVGKGGTIRVVELGKNGERNLDSAKSLTAPTTSTSNNRNGWVQYNFYVQGNGLENKFISLELSLGNEQENTQGYVFYDDITLQQVSQNIFLKATATTQSGILNLEQSNNKLFMIANQSFNHVSQTGIEQVIYPAIPNSWTFAEQTKYQNSGLINGVINTNPTHFNENRKFYPDNMPNPGTIKYDNVSNNVLVMGSRTTSDNLTYTSESFSFEKNTKYYLSFYFYSHLLNSTNNDSMINIKIFNNDFVIGEHEFAKTSSNGWKQFVFEISTGLISGSFQVQLNFANTKGYVFFDDFYLTSTPHQTDRYAQKIIMDTNINNFSSFSNFKKSSTYDSQTFANVTKNNLDFLEFCGINDISYINDGNLSALYILNEAKAITTLESTNAFALMGGQYYKISVWIKTSYLYSDEESENMGASFAVNYGDVINEQIGINSNDYTQYSFYINPENNIDAKIIFGLGGKDAPLYGIAYFDGLEIITFASLTEFEEDQVDKTAENIKVIKAAIITDEDKPSIEEHDSHDHDGSANLLMAASGIITGVAIIIAMLGTGIRKIKLRRPTKISTTYDRRKTLNKSLDRQELIELHEGLIKEIETELAEEKAAFKEREEIITGKINEYNKKLNEETAELKTKFMQFEKYKDIQEQILNAKIAENKAETSLKDDRENEKQIAKIVAQQKKVQKEIFKIENKYESEIYKLENMLANFALKPQFLEQEIADFKKDIEKIKEKEKSAALNLKKVNKKVDIK